MRMKIQPKRLLSMLTPLGFALGRVSTIEDSFELVRVSKTPALYEAVMVSSQGKRGEAVSATIGISVTKLVMTKGLVETRLLMEVADVKELVDEYGFWVPGRGQAIIETTERAKQWEEQLASVASERAAEMAADVGPELLERTKSARNAVGKYLECLSDIKEVGNQLRCLRQQAERPIVAEAERLANWPGVLQEVGTEEVYLMATLCILHFQHHVENTTGSFIGCDPLENEQLMWRIQLLVDKLRTASAPG